MFDFFSMMGNYEDRKVDRFENEDMSIDTCSVTDGDHPYETAVKHFQYHNNDWVVVQSYDTKEEAQKGHDKWIEIMTSDNLPEYLRDCGNAGISQLMDLFCGEESMIFPRRNNNEKA